MSTKRLTCIECPKSCSLAVDIENCRVVTVSGNLCPRGEEYAKAEVENPLRILTGTVLTEGLPLRMLPVRTDKPIPKVKMTEAAAELRKMRILKRCAPGEILMPNFIGLGVNLIATRGSG